MKIWSRPVRLTQLLEKSVSPIFVQLIDIPVTTMLVHECSSPNDYPMGTTGCKIFTHQPNRHRYRNTHSCKSVCHILSPGNSRNYCTTASWPSYEKCGTRAEMHRTNQGMGNVNSWQNVHWSTPGWKRLTGRYSQLTEKKITEQTENIKFPRVSYNPSSSPRGQFSPKPSLYVVPLFNPMRLSVHFDQALSKNAMRPVDSQHQKFHHCLGHTGHLHSAAVVSNSKLTTELTHQVLNTYLFGTAIARETTLTTATTLCHAQFSPSPLQGQSGDPNYRPQ